MDEWLSVGDADFVQKADARLTELVSNARAVVIASHNHSMIRDKCNVVIKLDHGRIASLERTDVRSSVQDSQAIAW
jgi:lipopolysaccharide transport system ATP-binding protein